MPSVALDQFDNTWYQPGGNVAGRLCWYYVNLIFFQSAWFPSSFLKILLLRCFGAKVGKGVTIKPSVNIKYPWRLHIGDYVWIDHLVEEHISRHLCNYQVPFYSLLLLLIVTDIT